jgi:PQQ-dependent catabolism-associated CXXCW motif protein
MRWHAALVLSLVVFAGSGALPDDNAPPEPDGYRMDEYRAATPKTLRGARVISTADAEALWRGKVAVFLDVMPQAPRPANLPPGTIWRDKARLNIPGSIWLPDTGYGSLAPSTEDYLRAGLDRATGADRAKLIVVYCLMDCWMSWNAAKRVAALGYRNVAWFPEGTDGWQLADLPLEQAKPEPHPHR